jgi:hypothetical protein
MSYQVILESWKDEVLDNSKTHDFQNIKDAENFIQTEKAEIDFDQHEIDEYFDDLDIKNGLRLLYNDNDFEWAYFYYLKEVPDRILCAAIHYQSATSSPQH